MEVQAGKKFRKRKRGKLLGKICQQMEFYFGDSNLAKDKFLATRIGEDPDGYVNLDLFLKFNKILELTSDVKDIVDALASSEILEVASDGKRLRRKKPVEKTNFDDCTIYVERLPPHADHKWLRDVFNHFGTVMHTSIPHFRASKKAKGFAFIEFESPESVVKACKHFKTSTESGESDTGEESDDPKDKKISGKMKKSQSHYKEHQSAKGKEGVPHRSNKKRKRNESEGSERFGSYRRSVENEDADGRSTMQSSEVNGKSEAVDINRSASELESCDERSETKSTGAKEHPETVEPKSDAGSPYKGGKKRRRRDTDNEGTPKKVKYEQQASTSIDTADTVKPQAQISGSDSESKSGTDVKIKFDIKIEDSSEHSACEVDGETPSENVAVMCGSADGNDKAEKIESEVSDINCTLSKRQKKRRRKKKNKSDDDKPHLRVLTKAEWKTYRNKYLSLQRSSMVHVKKMLCLNQQTHFEGDIDEDNYDESPVKEEKSFCEGGVTYQPGVIIKIKLTEPVENSQKLRKQVTSSADVCYVDATEGSSEVYVRCPNSEAASAIIEEARFAEIGDTEIVKDTEETAYWEKVVADRDAKFRNKRKHKGRGRDKLISRATKLLGMNTHVYYDD